MTSSPVYTKYKTGDYIGYEFDPQVDFAQFLKEARTQACEQSFEEALPYSDEVAKIQMDEGQKNKKSWRRSLFSWLKADKKSKPGTVERSNNNINSSYNISKPVRGSVSGPIHPNGGGATSRARRPRSGPLTGLFSSTKKMEDGNHKKITYTCLSNPHNVQSYGPVYMVT